MKRFTIIALALAIVLATLVSQFASSKPDGLERVATDYGFADRATSAGDYGDGPVTSALFGLGGTLLVFTVGYGIARRRAS